MTADTERLVHEKVSFDSVHNFFFDAQSNFENYFWHILLFIVEMVGWPSKQKKKKKSVWRRYIDRNASAGSFDVEDAPRSGRLVEVEKDKIKGTD